MKPKFNREAIRLIMGIGNPDDHYQHTYHNAGILFARFLAAEFCASPKRSPHSSFSLYSGGLFSLAVSRAPMNASGAAVARALHALCLTPSDLLLAHDESDLPLGSYRLGYGGGAAGHHGVLSVARALHTRDFWRLRIGIRDTSPRPLRAGDYVLSPLPPAHERALQGVFRAALESLLTG